MTRDDAQAALLTAARALQQGCPLALVLEGAPVRPLLAQLYAAVAACDAVDGAAAVRPEFCQADPECLWQADLPSHTCYRHSPWATAERVRAVMRDPLFGGDDAD